MCIPSSREYGQRICGGAWAAYPHGSAGGCGGSQLPKAGEGFSSQPPYTIMIDPYPYRTCLPYDRPLSIEPPDPIIEPYHESPVDL